MSSKLVEVTGLLLLMAAVWPADALAYIDPGTGSLLIQGVIATLAAIGVTLKLYWHRFVGLFRRRPAHASEREERAGEEARSEQE